MQVLTLILFLGNLLLPKETQGGTNYPPVSRVSLFYGTDVTRIQSGGSSPCVLFGASVPLFLKAKQTQGGSMPKNAALNRLQTEADCMVIALKEQLQFTSPRKFNTEKIKIYSKHLVYLLGEIERKRLELRYE